MKLLFKHNNIPYILAYSKYTDANYNKFTSIPTNIIFECYYVVAGILKLDSSEYVLYTNINDFPKKYKDILNKKFNTSQPVLYYNSLWRVK